MKSLTSLQSAQPSLPPALSALSPLPLACPPSPAPSATTDNVCGKTADARGITAENLPDIDATNASSWAKTAPSTMGAAPMSRSKLPRSPRS
ncbi:MAG: hypothetical protein ACLTYW_04370 [Collinsella sp.]